AYPDGAEVYKLFVRGQTTLSLDARTVHEIGVAEMARVHVQIADVMKQVGFTGSYAEFADQLADDPKSYSTNADDLLAGYRDIAKRVDPQLTKLFITLPRTPYGIRAIPAYEGTNKIGHYSRAPASAAT